MWLTCSLRIVSNMLVLLVLLNANVLAGDNCPATETDDVDAAITDHIFVYGDNGTPENKCLASNTITVGGVPSKWVIIEEGAQVYLIAPQGIGFGSDVLVEQGSTLYAVPTNRAKLNDTGITNCSDGTTNYLPCPVEGYPGQDAEYGRDVTHNDNADGHAGFSFTRQGTQCVEDNVIGLVWELKTDDGGLHDSSDQYSWYNTDSATNGGYQGYADIGNACHGYNSNDPASYCNTQAYVERVNQAGWCGHNDWRMPTIKELENIARLDRQHPSIDTEFFPNTLSSEYWSASPHANYSFNAWYVKFEIGNSDYYEKGMNLRVRLVRDGQ